MRKTMRTIHFHIGPHKTGSTAIQKMIRLHSELLEKTHNLFPVNDPLVNQITQSLNKGDRDAAILELQKLADICAAKPGDCLISSEDFAGELPGRSNKRKPYPKLFENINTIRKAFPDFRCKFYFFTRTPDEWLRSSYAQIMKHGSRFHSFEGFTSFLHTQDLWDETLKKIRDKMRSDFTEIRYEEGESFSSVNALLWAILGSDTELKIPQDSRRPNQSNSATVVTLFEAVNRSGASPEAQRLAKKSLQTDATIEALDPEDLRTQPDWPPKVTKPDWLSPGLEALWKRTDQRVHRQDQPNLLPDPYCDLLAYRLTPVDAPDEFPAVARGEMENQVRILEYRFRGLPKACFLLGLTISYLRRDTDHTEHAAFLFQRLWHEEYAVLLGTLPTRWLISAFQTFLDHGANEAQRQIGAAAYFLSNILKAYEAERALDGLPPDATYPSTAPTTRSGFSGMDRFKLGGTDLLLNTNALLLELAVQDALAGRVVQEFLLRSKNAASIFSRMDQSRIKHDVDIPQFANCWSFFEDPRGEDSKE